MTLESQGYEMGHKIMHNRIDFFIPTSIAFSTDPSNFNLKTSTLPDIRKKGNLQEFASVKL